MKIMNKKILLCVSGGIAAYKAIELASSLKKRGAIVRTILTDGATKFVTPLSFSAITGNKAHTSLFEDDDPIPHISLADWADLLVVAPATANVLAKAATGLSDDLLSATMLAYNRPILFVPAMNVNMYENPATQDNIALLTARGHIVLQPATGMLACGYEGKGKYPPNSAVLNAIATFPEHTQDCTGLRVLVTAGACEEAIDPMRFITNRSSGKMGIAIAEAFAVRGAEVDLIHADLSVEIPHYLHEVSEHRSAESMYRAVMAKHHLYDVIVMCAAVSDYTPIDPSLNKIKKTESLTLELKATADILAALGKVVEKPRQKLIGFAAETENLIENARKKLIAKNLDLIVVNNISVAAKDNTCVDFISGEEITHAEGDKLEVAHLLVDRVRQL